jgi:hypothetical protein
MGNYRVKAGHRLTYGTSAQDVKEAREGELVDLSDEDVKRYGDAVEPDSPELAKAWEQRNKAQQDQRQKLGGAAPPQGGGIDPAFSAPTPPPQPARAGQPAGGEQHADDKRGGGLFGGHKKDH